MWSRSDVAATTIKDALNATDTHVGHLVEAGKRFGQGLLAIGENRLELLLVEVQEERERLFHALLLIIGAAVCGLLAAAALTGATVVLLWEYSPVATLLVVTSLCAGASLWFGWRLRRLLSEWRHFSATIDQLRKDRACLEKHIT
jgi:uncharacterized membrane protein YqjE